MYDVQEKARSQWMILACFYVQEQWGRGWYERMEFGVPPYFSLFSRPFSWKRKRISGQISSYYRTKKKKKRADDEERNTPCVLFTSSICTYNSIVKKCHWDTKWILCCIQCDEKKNENTICYQPRIWLLLSNMSASALLHFK